jgi:hypothetical protein
MTTRGCAQCGTVFAPRREHARFCSPGCRVDWNRSHLTDAAAEERALEWSLTGMRDVVERLGLDQPADPSAAFSAVEEAVWWITIIDARMIRQYMDLYDTVLATCAPAHQPRIEGTLAGLRFVRNLVSEDRQAALIEPPAIAGQEGAVTAAWRWAHLPEPELSARPAHVQPWEMTRYQAYEQWLAGNRVGQVFQQAGDFLTLAASQVTASRLTARALSSAW